ncbi:MAG: Nramp family divalent metal transporter [bacterium]
MSETFLKKIKNKALKTLKILGPGFVTGSADDDPSGIGTYSIAGAKYGLLLAWLVPFQLPLMFAIQEMCARIGLVTGKGLAANMKRFFPKPILYCAIFILIFANIINIGADITIMAASANLVSGLSGNVLAITITIIIILMEIFISYHVYSKILLFFSIFLLAYVITAFITTQNWLEVLQYTFTPHFKFDKDFILVMTGFIGTTISPYLFFWQTSHEIENNLDQGVTNRSKRILKKSIIKTHTDTFLGMLFSQIIALFIVITCYSVLHAHGTTEINSAYDAALALKPLAGEWASWLFAIGIIGAGLLGIPVLAGSCAYALSELFNYKEGLSYKFKDALFFYGVIATSTLIGLLINFIGINPIKMLLYAAVVNGIAAVPLVAFVIILANKKEVMGTNKNGLFSNIVGGINFSIMLLSAILVFIFI